MSEGLHLANALRYLGHTSTNCILKSDLSMVPKESFKNKSQINKDGKRFTWWEVHYKLLVKIESGPMVFSLLCGGKEYGKVGAEY